MQQRGTVDSQANRRLADIAARVVEEFISDEYYDEFYFERDDYVYEDPGFVEREITNPDGEGGGSDFSFASFDSDLPSPVSPADIFRDGRIRPVYPVPDPKSRGGFGGNDVVSVSAARLPLRKLFIEERETTVTMMETSSSSSSSDADELEGVPEETYCVWQPKEAGAAEERCKKSNSTGSNSTRWNKFRDLLNRSLSDGGKDRFVFLSPSFSGRRRENVKSAAATVVSRLSYLPCKQDLLAQFSRVKTG